MAKDRIDRNELADKLVQTASAAEDPLRTMAEMIADFVMEAEVTQKIGAEPHERSEERTGYRNGHRQHVGIRVWERARAVTCRVSSSIGSAASKR